MHALDTTPQILCVPKNVIIAVATVVIAVGTFIGYVKDIGMGVRKGAVVSCVPTLFGCFLGIPSL